MVAANKIGLDMPPKQGKAIPRTYGEGENFELYVNHFNRIAASNGWDEQTKLAYLETKLTGRAQREFEVFIEEEPRITFADITEKLIEELVPSPQKALELFTGMRLERKSPKEFYGSLVRQSKLAHGDMGDHARHIIVRTQMLQVLPNKLRKAAAMQGYLADMDKEGFLQLLTRVYDAEMRDEVGEVGYEPAVCQVQGATMDCRLKQLEEKDKARDKDMAEMMGMMREMYKGSQQSSSGGQRRYTGGRQFGSDGRTATRGECFKCFKEGHFARECPNPVVCAKCRQEGHVRAECPKN